VPQQIQEATRRQVAAGLPVPNGVVPQVRPPGFVPPQGIPSGITGMPNLANVQNPAQRQVIQQAANANALSGMSAQAMAINNRTVAAQAQLAGAQRLAPQMTGTIANNDNMRRMLAMQQNNAMFNQQQMQAGQLQRQASGNGNNAMNGISNAAMLNQFGNPPMRSPGIPQQQDGTAAHASPHAQQATINRMQPQSLSNGHVPPIVTLQNQVRAANPTYSDAQVNHIAGEQLKQFMAQSAQSRQNAMSATANGNMNRANGSMNASNFAQQQQQQQLQNNNMYSPASNMLGTPQQRAAANQAAQTRNAGSPPHQAVNLLATPTQQQLQQAQSQAQAQLNGQQPGQQSQYSAGIRQQMYNMQRMQQNGNGAAPSTNGNHRSPNQQQISPAAGFVMPVNANVAAGFQRPNGPTTPAAAQQGSMRPPSRTPSSMGVTTQGQHLSPQQQLAQMQRSISNSGGQQQATPQMMQRTMSNGQGRGGMQAQMQRTVSGSGGNGYPMQAMGMGSVSPMPQGMTQQHVQGIMQSGGKMGGQ
jgi:chromatin modification-related protein VID21